MVKLSVILPTTGRDTLQRSIDSCEGADELIVIEDHTGDYGYTPRHKGIAQATGTHLVFLDDDDVFAPGAIQMFKDAACDVPVIFKMDHWKHGTLWRDKNVSFGNVSTPTFVVPNQPDKLGVWEVHLAGAEEPGGDYVFLDGCCRKMGDPIWREEIVAIVRPQIERPVLSPSITIVTPWRNNRHFEEGYLPAVRCVKVEMLVIDDHSDVPIPWAIPAGEKTGFSACNNIGLALAETDAVLFLNSDVVSPCRDWIEPIRELIEPGVFVGAQLRYDRHGQVDGVAHPYIDGWCLAGMRDDLDMIGGWDENLVEHGYYADNDISFRARLAGITLKEARIPLIHLRDAIPQPPPGPHVQQVTLQNKARFEARVREALGVAA